MAGNVMRLFADEDGLLLDRAFSKIGRGLTGVFLEISNEVVYVAVSHGIGYFRDSTAQIS